MADPSMTTAPIMALLAGDCWAGRQLPKGIKDVPVAAKLMKSLTLVRGGFLGSPVLLELHVRILHNHWAHSRSDYGRLLGSTPATQRYKVCPEVPMAYGAIGSQEGGWLRWGRLG